MNRGHRVAVGERTVVKVARFGCQPGRTLKTPRIVCGAA